MAYSGCKWLYIKGIDASYICNVLTCSILADFEIWSLKPNNCKLYVSTYVYYLLCCLQAHGWRLFIFVVTKSNTSLTGILLSLK